jgi:hypothetical protein
MSNRNEEAFIAQSARIVRHPQLVKVGEWKKRKNDWTGRNLMHCANQQQLKRKTNTAGESDKSPNERLH